MIVQYSTKRRETMRPIVIHRGDRYNEWTAVKPAVHPTTPGRFWLCVCSCGNKSLISPSRLASGRTLDCGHSQGARLAKRNMTHGYTRKKDGERRVPRTYSAWQGMKDRCYNTNAHNYKHYGGRGIKVCARWRHSFAN